MSITTKKLDSIGRITVPIKMREALGWGDNEIIELALSENGIELKKAAPQCALCGKDGGRLVKIGVSYICPDCVYQIQEIG